MNFTRKLRPPEFNIETYFGLSMAPIMAFLFILFGLRTMFLFVGLVEMLVMFIHINLYRKSKNIAFLWMAAAFFIFTIFLFELAIFGLDKYRKEYPLIALGVIMAAGIILFMVINKRVKWRTREIFELAAMPISETLNGFTERPLPSGKINGTKFEIEEFTRFVGKNLIAIPYIEQDRIVYSLTSNYWKKIGLKNGYDDESWISISKEGWVDVFIAREDYQKFKDDFTFDQLCASLGELLIEFFELFRRGDGVRIIQRFNDLRLNPIIE